MRLLFLILFLLVSCGENKHGVDYGFKEPELKLYEDLFIRDALILGRIPVPTTRIYFKDLSEDPDYKTALAYAVFPLREIVVNTFYWEHLTPREKKWTMYHELIHASCFFLDHKEDTVMNTHLESKKIKEMTDRELNEYLWSGIEEFCILGKKVSR